MKRIVLLLICLSFYQSAYGYSDFYKSSKRGWFWFEQREASFPNSYAMEPDDGIAPLTKLQAFQEEIEQAKAAMIMTPSVENSRKYIKLQNKMFIRASEVSKNWQAAMLADPEIDLVKDTPISKQGADIARRTKAQENSKKLFRFAKEFKLLFFYKGNCEFCGPFADVLEGFSRRYGFKVASVTLDGKSLKNFPATTNPDLVEKFKVRYTPSIFAYSEKERVAVPLAYGYTNLDLLEQNTVFMIDEILLKL